MSSHSLFRETLLPQWGQWLAGQSLRALVLKSGFPSSARPSCTGTLSSKEDQYDSSQLTKEKSKASPPEAWYRNTSLYFFFNVFIRNWIYKFYICKKKCSVLAWHFKILLYHRELSLVLWSPRGGETGECEGGSRGRGYMYICSWFMLLYNRNQHNIVKQLYSNKKR